MNFDIIKRSLESTASSGNRGSMMEEEHLGLQRGVRSDVTASVAMNQLEERKTASNQQDDEERTINNAAPVRTVQ